MSKLKILVVDDDEVTRNLLTEVLEKEDFSVSQASSGEAALQIIQKQNFSVILSDIRMLEVDGMQVLSTVKEKKLDTVVILMTGFGNLEGAVKAIQEGAFDYISKPFRIQELKQLVQKAAKHWLSLQEIVPEAKTQKVELSPRSFIGKSPQIVEVYKNLARAAISTSSVFVFGESGTGKELVARAIHENSSRKTKRFVAINCGALTESLLESELFGHVKGSFTGATTDKRGVLDEANHGSLFLDEIGDISQGLQVKLLRVLQEGEFRPVGSSENKKVDVRVIAATHRSLEQMVKEGKFREDLYYRLKVISIHLPPLRERQEDLPELVSHFLALYSEKNHKRISHVSEAAMAELKRYSWPGNIRELEHAIERAVAMSGGNVLFPEDFPEEIRKAGSANPAMLGAMESDPNRSLEDVEKEHILRVLKEVNYNKSKASEVLGIDRATLYRKAQKLGIDLTKG